MKKAKLIFGLLMLTIFSLSFVMNNNSQDGEQKEAVSKKIRIPSNG